MESKKLTELFESKKLFERIGEKEVIDGVNFEYVESSSEFEKKINGLKWENLINEKRGDIFVVLYKNVRERADEWDEWVKKNGTDIDNAVLDRLTNTEVSLLLKDEICSMIQYNFFLIGISQYFKDVYYDEFWDQVFVIYQSGHIPCGYKKGKFLIY